MPAGEGREDLAVREDGLQIFAAGRRVVVELSPDSFEIRAAVRFFVAGA